MPYRWDPKSKRYRDPKGRYVSESEIRQLLDVAIDAKEVTLLTRAYKQGDISKDTWLAGMESAIKKSHLQAGMLAKGGKNALSAKDLEAMGVNAGEQFYHLKEKPDSFLDSIDDLTEAQAIARAKMYVQASRQQYEEFIRDNKIDIGAVWEKWILSSAEHCGGCLELAAMGFVPIGTLGTVPGAGATECLTNCKCRISYYNRRRRTLREYLLGSAKSGNWGHSGGRGGKGNPGGSQPRSGAFSIPTLGPTPSTPFAGVELLDQKALIDKFTAVGGDVGELEKGGKLVAFYDPAGKKAYIDQDTPKKAEISFGRSAVSVDNSIEGRFRHEYGHHVWRYGLDFRQRRAWEKVYEKARPDYWRVQVSYKASKGAEEAFSELYSAFSGGVSAQSQIKAVRGSWKVFEGIVGNPVDLEEEYTELSISLVFRSLQGRAFSYYEEMNLIVFDEPQGHVAAKLARPRRDKCMRCSQKPAVEVKWANGKGHAWFCADCYPKWKKEDGWHEVDYEKEIEYGVARPDFSDPLSPKSLEES